PPVTPSRSRRPRGSATSVDLDDLLGALVVDLALGDLFEGDRERLVAETRLDEGRDELASPLTELVVIGVDLASSLGRQDHQGVLGVDRRKQVIDLGFDHGWSSRRVLPAGQMVRDASMIAATSSAARSTSSFTTTASNQVDSSSSRAASRRRSAIIASVSVPRPRSRCSSSSSDGGSKKISRASGTRSRTCSAPLTSISRMT